MIYTGETLYIPGHAPAHYQLTDYAPRHASPRPRHAKPTTDGSGTAQRSSRTAKPERQLVLALTFARTRTPQEHTWSGSGRQRLRHAERHARLPWPRAAVGGRRAAARPTRSPWPRRSRWPSPAGTRTRISPTDDFGYWQINAVDGSLATYDPYGRTRAPPSHHLPRRHRLVPVDHLYQQCGVRRAAADTRRNVEFPDPGRNLNSKLSRPHKITAAPAGAAAVV